MSKAVNIIVFITITIILFSALIQYESFTSELVSTVSTIDGRKYLVRNRIDKQKAANLLAIVRKKCTYLCEYLGDKYTDNIAVNRLINKFNPNNMIESSKNSRYTSYSINKGERIVFCIRSRDDKEKLVKLNVLMFVALHELAHIMTKSIGHTDEFWSNFKFLLQQAVDAKIYKNQDFRRKPVKYCGTEITDSPLND